MVALPPHFFDFRRRAGRVVGELQLDNRIVRWNPQSRRIGRFGRFRRASVEDQPWLGLAHTEPPFSNNTRQKVRTHAWNNRT
jgi:hypothetical protein